MEQQSAFIVNDPNANHVLYLLMTKYHCSNTLIKHRSRHNLTTTMKTLSKYKVVVKIRRNKQLLKKDPIKT